MTRRAGEALRILNSWSRELGKRPLLLLDNIDLVFGLLKKDHWGLRNVLQKPGGIVVIGASSVHLESSFHSEAAFYEFFEVDTLEKLTDVELVSCLRQLAAERGEPGRRVLRVLDQEPGRVRALYYLTGGNPRTLAMLYMMLEVSDEGDLMRDLERLLDQATPALQGPD